MATKQTIIREKLQSKVFDVLGKSVTLKRKTSPIYNSRGELESQTWVTSTITVVNYDVIDDRTNHSRLGEIQAGEQYVAIPYTVSISKGDIIVLPELTTGTSTENWYVRELQPNPLPDNVVTIAILTRVQP